jgi:hypothetical protein
LQPVYVLHRRSDGNILLQHFQRYRYGRSGAGFTLDIHRMCIQKQGYASDAFHHRPSPTIEEANSTFANAEQTASTPPTDNYGLGSCSRSDFLHMVFYSTAGEHTEQLQRWQPGAIARSFTLAADFPSSVARYHGVTPPADVSQRC